MFDYKYKYPVESIAKQVYIGNAMCWAKKMPCAGLKQ